MPQSLDTVSINNLAGLYLNQGRYDEAEPSCPKERQPRPQGSRARPPTNTHQRQQPSFSVPNRGRNAESEQLLKEALAGNRKARGDSHPDTLDSINNLAALYYSQTRYAEVGPLSRECLDGITKHLERTGTLPSDA